MFPERHTIVGVTSELVEDLTRWFSTYVQTFKNGATDIQNIVLKEEHTKRVCGEIVNIGEQLGLPDRELRLAEVTALLHDIGRFEQYARYRTFADQRSEDHAELGVKVLKQLGVLDQCEKSTQDLILRTIRYHNRATLPREETEACLFFTKLLRDADKLDIWQVVTDYYRRKDGERNGALELDLPDTPGFSDAVYQDLLNREIVDMNHVKTLNDFKLLQIGWIFDINFGPTLRAICSRQYLEIIRDALPQSKKIDTIFAIIHAYIEKRFTTSNDETGYERR